MVALFAGSNLLLFSEILDFLCERNLLLHLQTASQILVQILFGEGGCLPVGLGLPAVVYESSEASNESDESVQLGEFLVDVFLRLLDTRYGLL